MFTGIITDVGAVLALGLHVVTVGVRNEVEWDLFGARFVTLAMVGAGPEVVLHGLDHVLGAVPAFSLTLGQQVQVLHLGRRE